MRQSGFAGNALVHGARKTDGALGCRREVQQKVVDRARILAADNLHSVRNFDQRFYGASARRGPGQSLVKSFFGAVCAGIKCPSLAIPVARDGGPASQLASTANSRHSLRSFQHQEFHDVRGQNAYVLLEKTTSSLS